MQTGADTKQAYTRVDDVQGVLEMSVVAMSGVGRDGPMSEGKQNVGAPGPGPSPALDLMFVMLCILRCPAEPQITEAHRRRSARAEAGGGNWR